eukprot:gene7950-1166_t
MGAVLCCCCDPSKEERLLDDPSSIEAAVSSIVPTKEKEAALMAFTEPPGSPDSETHPAPVVSRTSPGPEVQLSPALPPYFASSQPEPPQPQAPLPVSQPPRGSVGALQDSYISPHLLQASASLQGKNLVKVLQASATQQDSNISPHLLQASASPQGNNSVQILTSSHQPGDMPAPNMSAPTPNMTAPDMTAPTSRSHHFEPSPFFRADDTDSHGPYSSPLGGVAEAPVTDNTAGVGGTQAAPSEAGPGPAAEASPAAAGVETTFKTDANVALLEDAETADESSAEVPSSGARSKGSKKSRKKKGGK